MDFGIQEGSGPETNYPWILKNNCITFLTQENNGEGF
jgi:hypothetical protein